MDTQRNVFSLDVGNPWKNLANAIVTQAAHDYKLTFSRDNNDIDRSEVIKFFRSDWYKVLTSVDA